MPRYNKEPLCSPETFGKSLGGLNDKHFKLRLWRYKSVEHFRAAVKYEAETRARTERIAKLNQRINELE